MGHKLDLSGLTELEAEHVLQVVQRDMMLRKNEEQRLSDLRRELEEEDARRRLLSRQARFNQLCCIRCCLPFHFLLNPRRRCGDCLLNVCPACRAYRQAGRTWICSTCRKRRQLKTQSLEWFYENVKRRFKRFGSAKVLKTLYRKHLANRGALAELTEGSTYEDGARTEDSVCESDAALCRQSEEHGLADTLTVAKRVAADAIDEAISKAEFQSDNQAKQNEANYLREHRGELEEELAKTIVQKIIMRRKALAGMRPGLDQECPQHSGQGSLSRQPKIWRSQSAFSLLDNDVPDLNPPLGLRNDGGGSAISVWQSVDRLLDNSVLKSPDGNWITLQSGQLSRPSLLTRRKSLVFSALEQESGLVSAYRALDSEPETPPEYHGSWGAVLQDLHRKMTSGGGGVLDLPDLEGEPPCPAGRRSSVDGEGAPRHRRPSLAFLKRQLPMEVRRPSSSRRTSVIDVNFNPEGAAAGESSRGESSRGESSGGEALKDSGLVRRSRRKRRSKKERGSSSSTLLRCNPNRQDANNGNPAHNSTSQHASDVTAADTLTSEAATPDPLDLEGGVRRVGGGVTGEELVHRLQQLASRGSLSSEASVAAGDGDGRHPGGQEEKQNGDGGEVRPEECGRSGQEGEEDGRHRRGGDEHREEEEEEAGEEGKMEHNLCRFAAQAGVAEPAHPELTAAGQSEGGWETVRGESEQEEEEVVNGRNSRAAGEEKEELLFQLLHLESQVRATQFSSTEDELDRIGRGDRHAKGGARGEELAARLRRLAEQVSGGELSSTDDELEEAGLGGGSQGSPEKETLLWGAEAEEVGEPSQIRDLVNLVSASQFSSTEDELDRAGRGGVGGGGGGIWRVERGGPSTDSTAESRGSVAHFSEGMFDFLDAQEAESISKAVDAAALAMEGWETSARSRDREEEPAGPPARRRQGEERTREGTAHRDWSAEEGERGACSLNRDLTPVCAPVRREQENRGESGLQTEQGEETRRWTSRDPTVTIGQTRVSEGDISCDEPELDNSGEKQVSRAVDPHQSETEIETRRDEDAGSDRIVGTVGEEGVRDEDRPERETAALSREGGGCEHDGHRWAPGTIRSGEGDPRRGKRRSGEDGTAGGSEEQGATDGGGQAGDVEPECEASLLSPEEIQSRYSAVSLCRLTTEMLMVLNATEDLLLQGATDPSTPSSAPQLLLSLDTDPRTLDQQFSRLEETVYVAAGTVFSLESELGDLEECASGVSGDTPDGELSFLEEQVASAAAKVQQSELQVSNISARIAALKSAGLNVDSHSRITQAKTAPTTPHAVPSSRHLRRRLPGPPGEGKEA